MTTPAHMVELRDVSMQFEEKKVLDGFSLKIEPEERVVIMGQSGSGKSTLLRLILGILRPNSGSILQLEATYEPERRAFARPVRWLALSGPSDARRFGSGRVFPKPKLRALNP